jgi:hypothetical protein
MHQDALAPAAVKRGIGEGQVMHVAMDEGAWILDPLRPSARHLQQSFAVVQADHPPGRADHAGQRADVVSQAASDIEQVLSLVHLQEVTAEELSEVRLLTTVVLQIADEALRVVRRVHVGEVPMSALPGSAVVYRTWARKPLVFSQGMNGPLPLPVSPPCARRAL